MPYLIKSNNSTSPGMMKKILQGAAIVGVLFAVIRCTDGIVEDKGAQGVAGEKTYSLEIRNPVRLGSDKLVVLVTEKQWESCDIGESYRKCVG